MSLKTRLIKFKFVFLQWTYDLIYTYTCKAIGSFAKNFRIGFAPTMNIIKNARPVL